MRKFINKFLCVLLNHKHRNGEAKYECDNYTQRCVVTETCCRCGKKNTFAFRTDV